MILERQDLNNLRCESIFSKSDFTEGKSLAERHISVPNMKREYVQKPTNISEEFLQNLSEKEMKVLFNFDQRLLAFTFEKLDVPFEQTQPKTEKGTEFKLNLPM